MTHVKEQRAERLKTKKTQQEAKEEPGSQLTQGVAPPIPWRPVSREIKGAETHWLASNGLGTPLMT